MSVTLPLPLRVLQEEEVEEGEVLPSFVTRLPDGAFVVDGIAPIRELRDRLAIPVPDSSDYTTAAGFVTHILGAIPEPGASVSYGGHRWVVVAMDGRRVRRLRVERE